MNTDILSKLVITKVNSVSTLYNPEKTKGKRYDRLRWAVVIKYEGETVYTSCGKRFISDLNHIAILPKSCAYDWECTKSGHFVIIDFECEEKYHEPIVCSVKNGEKILKLCKELEYKRNLPWDMIDIESIRDVYSIILSVASRAPDKYLPNAKLQKIKVAMEYLSQNIGEHITNDTLAELCGMSTVYFRKTFTEHMGVSPMVYAKQIRIEKAKEMLASDYGTLGDVAAALGYSSLYDFSRDFKKHTGVAPSKY